MIHALFADIDEFMSSACEIQLPFLNLKPILQLEYVKISHQK